MFELMQNQVYTIVIYVKEVCNEIEKGYDIRKYCYLIFFQISSRYKSYYDILKIVLLLI